MMQKNSKKNSRFHMTVAIGLAVSFLFAAFASAAIAAPPDSLLSRLGGTQTFYSQFIIAGGPIVWFILLPMSVVMLYLAIVLCVTITRKKLLPPDITTEIATNAANLTPHRLTDSLSNAKDLVSSSLYQAVTKAKLLNADPKQITLLAAESLQHRTLHMMRKVEACHTNCFRHDKSFQPAKRFRKPATPRPARRCNIDRTYYNFLGTARCNTGLCDIWNFQNTHRNNRNRSGDRNTNADSPNKFPTSYRKTAPSASARNTTCRTIAPTHQRTAN